ncbi:HEPN domain-containing protein [Streptomyces albidoflavus]|uniref:ApeA N-terminal domain 1-containing protein n=1 Tax=Streptomyces albidoflavus TaxID=1886 RepID=UPI00102015BC|nr:HEPN domain-containing protein [Streptomyces albidoflavus]
MKQFEEKGEWWLPGREKRKIPGILIIDDLGNAELALLGTLTDPMGDGLQATINGITTTTYSRDSLEASGTYPRILGQVENKAFTLEDCFQKRSRSNLMGGLATEVIHVHQVFKGAWFEEGEQASAIGVSFAPRFLTNWIMKGGISERSFLRDSDRLEGSDARFVVTGHEVPQEEVYLDNGATISLSQVLRLTGDGVSSHTVSQEYSFRIDTPEVETVTELIDMASDLQDLVSIATNRTASFDKMNFRHPGLKIEREGKPDYLPPIDFYAAWSAQGDNQKAPRNMVFKFSDLGGMPAVGEWAKVARTHRSALGRVMATRYSKSMYVSDRMLNRAASLESLDRHINPDKVHFKRMLLRCADLAGDQFKELIADQDRWADLVKRDRHDIAHHLGRNRESTEQFFLSETLYWLFIMCMLREMRAPESAFASLSTFSEYRWLATKVGAIVRVAK